LVTENKPRKAASKLTDAKIAALPVPASGYTLTWDKGTGLAVRVTEADGRAFIFDYRTNHGKRRRMTLGKWTPTFGITAARAKAAALNDEIAKGKDPLGDQTLAHAQFLARPTMTDLLADFIHEHAKIQDRETTWKGYEAMYAKHIAPYFKDKAVADVETGDITTILNRLRRPSDRYPKGQPARSNRVRALLSAMFNHAIRQRKWRTDNPVIGTSRLKEKNRIRSLDGVEAARLEMALAQCKNRRPSMLCTSCF
jgi:hypothetical protein